MKKKTVRWWLLLVLCVVLLWLIAVLYCTIPHRLYPQARSSYAMQWVTVKVGNETIADYLNGEADEGAEEQVPYETVDALLDQLEQLSYRKRLWPTGMEALSIAPDVIEISVRYSNGEGWDCWDVYLSPNRQACTRGSYQWMYSICNGEERYECVRALLEG